MFEEKETDQRNSAFPMTVYFYDIPNEKNHHLPYPVFLSGLS